MWEALARPSRRLKPGERIRFGDQDSESASFLTLVEAIGDGRWLVQFDSLKDQEGIIERHGHVPLPQYIKREDSPGDVERYQTVFADRAASAAAPTAGLHLTDTVLDSVRSRGIEVVTVDLAVGLDTFQPLRGRRLDDQVMHTEAYRVPPETAAAVAEASRVVAVGTTTVRALEAAAVGPSEGRTDLFIRPGFRFEVVDVLLTNFHVPRSSLLVLLEAFVGERWRLLYDHALREDYRFLSFGDAMLVPRHR